MRKEVLYLKIAKIMEEQILSETLRIGEKLPSIRSIQKIYNVSLNTAKQAFLELESKSLIESCPKSGYYVSKTSKRLQNKALNFGFELVSTEENTLPNGKSFITYEFAKGMNMQNC